VSGRAASLHTDGMKSVTSVRGAQRVAGCPWAISLTPRLEMPIIPSV
jgi:hypothetical protein